MTRPRPPHFPSAPGCPTRGAVVAGCALAVGATLAGGGLVAVAGAQPVHRVALDAAVATLAQRGQPEVSAPTLAALWDVDGSRGALRASGAATLASADRWAAQAVLAGSLFLDEGRWELGGVGSALRFRGVSPAGNVVLLARRRMARVGWGVWGGAGGGFVSRADIRAPIVAGELGGWWRSGGRTLSLAATAQRARLDSLGAMRPGVPSLPGPAATPGAPTTLSGAGGVVGTVARALAAGGGRPLAALELTGSAEWRHRRGELAATLGVRRAPAQFDRVRGLALGTAVWWAHPRAGVVLSGGEQFGDPLRGMPAVRHLSIGLRWRIAPAPTSLAAPRPTAASAVGSRAGSEGVVAELAGGPSGARRLRVHAPGARQVEVRGDWTDWQPVALERHGGHWELGAALPPGTRRLAVRLDGGAWQLPANLPAADDDFGSQVALLVVP